MAMKGDSNPPETLEWLEALDDVVRQEGEERAAFLLQELAKHGMNRRLPLPTAAITPFSNTIAPAEEKMMPGDLFMERRVRSLVRWNAMAMVMRGNDNDDGLGGHISSFSSSATLYDIGFNYFFRGTEDGHPGDLVFYQGHSAPGMYARSYLEGRLGEAQLDRFRREVGGGGLSSYPHPWLMPGYWQFPTVSMGLGPIQAIYQARVMKYQQDRGLIDHRDRQVWCYMGDGECDEPESLGAISLAGREGMGNLNFVINCNLQRLDGPVRGNGKIIQELERVFRGAGWNVVKVIWGANWDSLLARDHKGFLRRRMDEAVDGDYQTYAADQSGAHIREHFFGKYPELAEMVADMSDGDLWRLKRGGHDPDKVYAAYAAAVKHEGQPTVILAKTVKGYGLGSAGESLNPAHNQKKIEEETLRKFSERFNIPIPNDELADAPFIRPSEELSSYIKDRRTALGGSLPAKRIQCPTLEVPALDAFKPLLKGSGQRDVSTTMAFVEVLRKVLLRDQAIRRHLVPIVADEARTFGMEGLFAQLAIYAPFGQRYEPVDRDQLMWYREEENGQILQEGITEAGAVSSWIAAGTSYKTNGVPMIPFFIFYSMFGFQRVGDFIWAAADMQARGFLIGATSGRTTLNGEGLQHEDGHSHLVASTVPSCVAYDPTYGYELAVIIQDGLKRMYQDCESVFYYVTTMNENYPHPPMPEGAEEGIRKGMYLLRSSSSGAESKRVQLLGCGSILREVEAAAELLEQDFSIAADVWSVTSFTELRREGLAAERHGRLHPDDALRTCWVEQCLAATSGPIVAASDYMRAFADQIRAFVPRRYTVLGTDGFGRSDTREQLRDFFEVDRYHVAVAALKALADDGIVAVETVSEAIAKYRIDPEKPDPAAV
ncbi:MAG: pyruvate dehydrogenase (acetyl-transferring), homodimeric type [Halieaceae bacterium]|nr:pyruvate dehydrogenase (acetyl-transferring), homodimeric type [Halieaceae bacterium]